MSQLRNRIERLEQSAPKAIVLRLADGSGYPYNGYPLDLFGIGMGEIQYGRGELFNALQRTVSGTNCGRLWELLSVLAHGPVMNTPVASPPPQKIVIHT
jgi:hypothetical protein